jgi:diaminopropionate ammonia-lyase
LDVLPNPHRGRGLPAGTGLAEGRVVADASSAEALLARCPAAAPTPLLDAPALARRLGVARLHLKDERGRMGLGSFKALGAGHAIARMAATRVDRPGAPEGDDELSTALEGIVIACASAGNHGLSVAASAPVFGARAVVYLSEAVPEGFARRLRERGATVVRAGRDYEASMAAATAQAEARGWVLLSDSSWPGHVELPTAVMEGYLVIGAEIAEALDQPATHVFLQAGVGGLAAAMSALLRDRWGDEPTIVVVEPTAAPALLESVRAGRPVTAPGPASSMGRLDCKEPSHLALEELARSADHFVTVDDHEVAATVELLDRHGIATSPSGAAGVAALHHAAAHRVGLALEEHSRALAIITEAAEDAPLRYGIDH